ncbi:hypothetical protein BST61_g11466 [Cercospora zeina]
MGDVRMKCRRLISRELREMGARLSRDFRGEASPDFGLEITRLRAYDWPMVNTDTLPFSNPNEHYLYSCQTPAVAHAKPHLEAKARQTSSLTPPPDDLHAVAKHLNTRYRAVAQAGATREHRCTDTVLVQPCCPSTSVHCPTDEGVSDKLDMIAIHPSRHELTNEYSASGRHLAASGADYTHQSRCKMLLCSLI